MSEIKLFAFPTSPYAMKVACYLAFRQLDYQFIGVSPINFQQIRFTGKRQVPVLQIGDEWKLESQHIMLWLEEVYPGSQLSGNSASERADILAIDDWISEQLIPAMFRIVVDWPSIPAGLGNGWKLARAVNKATPIPFWIQCLWPAFLRKARFIVAMMDTQDRSLPLQQYQQNKIDEFIRLLNGGRFLGGRSQPSLADVSAFSVIVFPYRFGLKGDANWMDNEEIMRWIRAVQAGMPPNPFLVGQAQLPRSLPGGLLEK